jgi:hypothetical protein
MTSTAISKIPTCVDRPWFSLQDKNADNGSNNEPTMGDRIT